MIGISSRESVSLAAPRLSDRLRIQLAFVLFAAVLLPLATAFAFLTEPITMTGVATRSLALSCLAALGGLYIFRQTSQFPGVRRLEHAFPSIALSYGIVLIVLVVFRLEYSRVILLSGFAFCSLGIFASIIKKDNGNLGSLWYISEGGGARLCTIEGVDWRRLFEPTVPEQAGLGIAVDLRSELADDWVEMLAEAALSGVPVYHVKALEEALTGRVDIEHLSENTLGSLVPDIGFAKIKRLMDFALSLIALPPLLPLIVVVAVAVKLTSPGPIFYRQKRVGHRGKVFRIVKFRTMRVREGVANALESSITKNDDERITDVGRVLRRYRIDELPQIFNILKGEMSWIGPRPEVVALSNWYSERLPFYSYRHIVRPGVSGWAQVNQGHVAALGHVHDKLRYDFFYIKHFSMWLDMIIIGRTIRVVINGFGSK